MGKQIIYVVCPMCGLERPLIKTGSWMLVKKGHSRAEPKYQHDKPGPVRFDYVDIAGPFVRIKEAHGYPVGFLEQDIFSLDEALQTGGFDELLIQIRDKAQQITQALSSLP